MTGDAIPHWGAEWAEGSVRLGLWAPNQSAPRLRSRTGEVPMAAGPDGWFSCTVRGIAPGDDYAFVLDDGRAVPDPAARAQRADVHGPSVLVDPSRYRWQHDRPGRPWEEAVIYEIHVGTFTPEGTFAAAARRMDELADLGVTALELMPVAQFAGNRGWGYDGVLPYAVHPAYGTPDDLRALVDAAHGAGLMVLLDVVYNHFGPEGNYLHLYAPDFFDPARRTPWGASIAYEREPVRRFFIENALYWLRDYRLDGLRLDAIDHVWDRSEPEILVEIARAVRRAFPGEAIHLTTEDNRNITRLHERDNGAVPLYTAEWNDDWHNAAHVIATAESDGYYADFAAEPHAQLARALAEGFAYQGEPSSQTGKARGMPSAHLPPAAFIDFLQNHDQAGNRALGERIDALAPAAIVRALRAIFLLSPHVPLLFMGEEYGETRPFLFFTDFHGDLARDVREGRRREFASFGGFDDAGAIPDPNAPGTFAASRLDWSRRDTDGRERLDETRALLRLRHRHIVPHLAGAGGHTGQVVAAEDRVIAVDWRLDGAALFLRANLSDAETAVPPAGGRVLWGPTDESRMLGPWQVRVSMAADVR